MFPSDFIFFDFFPTLQFNCSLEGIGEGFFTILIVNEINKVKLKQVIEIFFKVKVTIHIMR